MSMQNPNDPHMQPTEFDPYIGYESYMNTPPPPPPPPSVKQKNSEVWLISVLAVVIILAMVITVVLISVLAGNPHGPNTILRDATQTVRVTTPTPLPNPTSISTPNVQTSTLAPYTAQAITADFSVAGLVSPPAYIDTDWSCCSYYPEGGADYWTDTVSGITMDIATFAQIDEAKIDAKNLSQKSFHAYVDNYCLLSYSGSPSDMNAYLNVMNEYCTY